MDANLLQELKILLANTASLAAQTQLAHWNIKGRNFFSLHPALGEQYDSLNEAVDGLAEYIRSLGEMSPGGITTFSRLSKVREITPTAHTEEQFVRNLIDGHNKCIDCALSVEKMAEGLKDQESLQISIDRVLAHRKTKWMLESFLG